MDLGQKRWQIARPAAFDPARDDFALTAYFRDRLTQQARPGEVVVEQALVSRGPGGDLWRDVRQETWGTRP